MKNSNNIKKKIILICSDGGHLAQILELEEWFTKYNYLLVTEISPSTLKLRDNYNIKYLKNRSKGKNRKLSFYWNLFINFFISLKIIFSHFPKVIITTGSHTALPMFLIGKLLNIKLIWILSFARIKSKAASANIIYPLVDKFIVQWPDMVKHYKKAIYLGKIY